MSNPFETWHGKDDDGSWRCKDAAGDGFGAALRAWRHERSFTHVSLAKAIDCDHSSISRIETGSRQPSRDMAIAICDALELTGYDRERLLNTAGVTEMQWSRDAWEEQKNGVRTPEMVHSGGDN